MNDIDTLLRAADPAAHTPDFTDAERFSHVDMVRAPRSPGSTLKPFLYALAFETRTLTPASLIEDAPLTLDTGNGLYAPQNYEPHYQGWVSVRRALGGSLNVPAVRTLVRLGPDAFLQRLRAAAGGQPQQPAQRQLHGQAHAPCFQAQLHLLTLFARGTQPGKRAENQRKD